MRLLLLLIFSFACSILQAAPSQSVPLSLAELATPEAMELAMPRLARELLATRAPNPTQEPERVTQMRLQLVAGDYASALTSIDRIRANQAAGGNADAALSFLQYELFARAQLAQAGSVGSSFDAAFDGVWQARFSKLSHQQAYRAAPAFAYDLPSAWNNLQRQALALKFDAGTVELATALDLVRLYQPYQAYRRIVPRAQDLLDADEQARYQREQVLVKGVDGTTLTAYVVQPLGAVTPLPTALVFTIYAEPERPWREALQAAAHGYIGVVAFSRGKLASTDRIAPYEHEVTDVNTVIDWISRQPWSNGSVGMYGGSYNGFSQWAALKNPHPALKTIVPYVAAIPGLGLPMENNVGLTANYGWAFYVSNNATLDSTTYDDRARWNQLTDRWFESGRPFREIDAIDGTPNPWLQRWLEHPSFDAYWQAMVPYGSDYSRIHIPVLSITGYYDDGQISAIEYLKQHEMHHPNPNHVLLIGPYDHVGAQRPRKPDVLRGYAIDPVAQMDTPAITFQWLDHVLRGAPRPALLKERINFQLMGANRWAGAPSLATLNASPTRFYLQGAARGAAQHVLTQIKPRQPSALLQQVDFKDRSTSSNDYYPDPIVRKELDRSSGYTFVSEPLPGPRVLAGTFSGELSIRINKRDVDLGVVLYELTAEGDYLHLSYSLGRASYGTDLTQRRLIKPGKKVRVAFSRTRMVARELRAGSRLVVQVNVNKNSGAQVNMGTGKDVSDERLSDAGAPLRITWYGDSFVALPLQ